MLAGLCIWLSLRLAASAQKGVRTDLAAFEELEIQVENAEVEIKKGKKFQVVCQMPKDEFPNMEYVSGKLIISDSMEETAEQGMLGDGIIKNVGKDREITVFIPEGRILTHCRVLVEHGDIEMKSVWINRVQAYCGKGEIDLDLKGNIEEYVVDLLVESGEIEVNGKDIREYRYQKNPGKEKEVYARTNYGDIDIEIR
jgi:hypothetical protein